MTRKTRWAAQAIANDIRRWLQMPNNRELIFTAPQCQMQAYLRDEMQRCELPPAAESLSLWYGSEGVIGMMEGRTDSLVLLYQACYYDAFAIETDAALQAANTHHRKGARVAFNETGLALARAITLDCLLEAETIYRCLVAGIEDNLFYDVETTQVTPYLLTIYAQWKALPLSDAIAETAQSGVYGPLLAAWQTEDAARLQQALTASGDFHVARSREHDDNDTYEFCQEVYRLHPVEILAVLRLREKIGASNPNIEHPVLNQPLGRLYPPRNVAREMLLEQVIDKEQTSRP